MRKALRFEALRRDGFACTYCGARASTEVQLQVDHVVPVALGGQDVASNLVTACADCNRGKAGRHLGEEFSEQVDEDAARWSDAMAQAARETEEEYRNRQAIGASFLEVWNTYGPGTDVGEDYIDTIMRFLANGLRPPDMGELVQVANNATARDPWLYFCGCCHNRLRDRHERAAEILREQKLAREGSPRGEDPNG